MAYSADQMRLVAERSQTIKARSTELILRARVECAISAVLVTGKLPASNQTPLSLAQVERVPYGARPTPQKFR